MIDIKSMCLEELRAYLADEPAFRAKQIYGWIHQKLVSDFDEMKNIPQSLREKLKKECTLTTLSPVALRVSKIDDTHKIFVRPRG